MANWFKPNIDRNGRILRGAVGVALIVAGILLVQSVWWAALILWAGGGFALFEALKGWCAARACGIKTKI